jgi:dCMP deaminase
MAEHIGSWSKDPNTKVGCLVVGPKREIRSTGYNGFPRGIEDSEERLINKKLKYPLIIHAEMNAVIHAAYIGVSLDGCTAYVTWAPCAKCACSLIQAGIKEIIHYYTEIPERWETEMKLAAEILEESGIKLTIVPRDTNPKGKE